MLLFSWYNERYRYSVNILLDEKSYKTYGNISIYNISYKNFMASKPLQVVFDEIDGFIKTCDEIRYLVLFDYGWLDKVCNRIKYLISEIKWFYR